MEDILCLDLGSTREDPGTSRPFVTRGVRSEGPDVCGLCSDEEDLANETSGILTVSENVPLGELTENAPLEELTAAEAKKPERELGGYTVLGSR